jgi:predicted kinase
MKKTKTQAKVVVLVGLPASGKSYFAKELWDNGYFVVNQDSVGSREACITKAKNALERGYNIVIDRCNINKKQRSFWTKLAKQYKAELDCVVFDPHVDICTQNAVSRKGHPNFPTDPDKIEEIIRKFEKEYEPPSKEEGFKSITHHHSYHGYSNTYFYRE